MLHDDAIIQQQQKKKKKKKKIGSENYQKLQLFTSPMFEQREIKKKRKNERKKEKRFFYSPFLCIVISSCFAVFAVCLCWWRCRYPDADVVGCDAVIAAGWPGAAPFTFLCSRTVSVYALHEWYVAILTTRFSLIHWSSMIRESAKKQANKKIYKDLISLFLPTVSCHFQFISNQWTSYFVPFSFSLVFFFYSHLFWLKPVKVFCMEIAFFSLFYSFF